MFGYVCPSVLLIAVLACIDNYMQLLYSFTSSIIYWLLKNHLIRSVINYIFILRSFINIFLNQFNSLLNFITLFYGRYHPVFRTSWYCFVYLFFESIHYCFSSLLNVIKIIKQYCEILLKYITLQYIQYYEIKNFVF